MTSLATPRTLLGGIARPRRPLVVAGAVAIVLLASHLVGPTGPLTARAPGAVPAVGGAAAPVAPGAPTRADATALATIESSLDRWATNLRANPEDFISATNMALLYSGRGRISGAVDDQSRALDAADRALAIEPAYGPARTLRATILVTLHDFPAALAEAEALYRDDPSQLGALATIGDARLELGDVDGAAAAFDQLAALAPGAPVTARLAHLAVLRGDASAAAALADTAITEANAAGESGPALGWYRLLAGTIAFGEGDISAARTFADAAARDWPGAVGVLTLQARIAAASGDPDAAITLLQRAIAAVPDPTAVALLGDLYAATGRATEAEEQYATMGAIAALTAATGVHDRTLAIFAADHGRDVDAAVVTTASALETRRDIYGYDAHAWALFAAGRAAEALEPMHRALELGTRDARLWYHAGLIELAAGDRERGVDWLERALALNPGFDALGAERAREALTDAR